MANLFTRAKPRDAGVVPVAPVALVSGHPLGVGLLAANLLASARPVDLAGANDAAPINAPVVAPAAIGVAPSLAGASQQGFSLAGDTFPAGATANMSVVGLFYRAATGQHGCFFKTGNATSSTGGDGFAMGVGGAGSSGFETPGDQFLTLYEGVRWIDTGVTIGVGWHAFGLTIDGSGYPHCYLDGRLVYSDTGASMQGIGSAGAPITQIGGYTASNGANRYFTGSLQWVLPYQLALTAAQHQQFAARPFEMLRPAA